MPRWRLADIPWFAILVGGLAAAAQALVTAATPDAIVAIVRQAESVRDLVETDDARTFLDAAKTLPDPGPRTIWSTPDRSASYSETQAAALPAETRAALVKRDVDAGFYYNTGFGAPALYARPLDLAAKAAPRKPGARPRVLDFGYGMIAQGRMLAASGCDVHGTDVWPVLPAIYSQPGDTGEIAGLAGRSGALTLHHGRWPADPAIAAAVGKNFDIFITKNVLKRGYVHPERPVDPSKLVTLGVDDPAFVRAMHDALTPGGVAIIYNISPAQNPPEKPFLPHADGRCPFPRELLESTGFEVIAYEADDTPMIHTMWKRLGLVEPETESALTGALFAQYTLLRRKN
jgi:hypothetical protein